MSRRYHIITTTTSLRHQFSISPDFAVTWDPHQWIANRVLPAAKNCGMGPRLKPFAYVGSSKRVLRRVLTEAGCRPDAEGAAHLDALPETFRDFIVEKI